MINEDEVELRVRAKARAEIPVEAKDDGVAFRCETRCSVIHFQSFSASLQRELANERHAVLLLLNPPPHPQTGGGNTTK